MTATGLLYAEASLWMKEEGAHIVTMSKHLLGRFGEIISVILYLFMGYASLIAYNAGGSQLIVNIVESFSPVALSKWASCAIFAIVFGSVFYMGSKVLGWINTLFVLGMVVAYFAMVSVGLAEVREELLARTNWGQFYAVIPLMITSFSFQMIVPSLALYLDHEPISLKRAIIFGTSIPAIAYAIWILVVLGIVPNSGEHGLEEAYKQGMVATESLKYFVQSEFIGQIAEYFAFFAIVTSYFGIGFGLYDFLADLTKIQKRGLGKFFLGLLVILPTLYFTVLFRNAFFFALDITGGLGDSILNGIIPVAMVAVGRYVVGHKSPWSLWGGKASLWLLFALSLLIIAAQIVKFVY